MILIPFPDSSNFALSESPNIMNAHDLPPRKRIAFSTFIPARLA
jgi:hypothetical protein